MEDTAETLASDGNRVVLRSLRVRVVRGPAAGEVRLLGRGALVVGAGVEADLVVADRRVSRRHLELVLVDGGVLLKDLDSRNGAYIAGARVKRAILAPGAHVEIGASELVVEPVDEPVALAERRSWGALSTESDVVARLYDLLARAAASDVRVLLEGPPGSGKSLLARALHDASGRAAGPFVVVDARAGGDVATALLRARGGTLVLDDVGAFDAPARRVPLLDEARDVRVLSTTGVELLGRLPQELVLRLAVVRARVPALSERLEDLPELSRALLRELGRDERLSPSVLAALRARPWPGNVAELRNILASAVALSAGGPLRVDVSAPAPEVPEPGGELRRARAQKDRQFLDELLAAHRGNVSAAARAAGIDRKHLHKLIARHGLDASRHRR